MIDGARAREVGQGLGRVADVPDYEKIAEAIEGVGVPADPPPPADGEEIPAEEVSARLPPVYPLNHEKYQGIAAAKGYDQSYARLQRMHYSHEAMIDVIIAEPTIKQNELAAKFGKTVGWISRIIGSDAFQASLAKRREELTDPFLVATIEERMTGLAMQSIDVLVEKLEITKNADLAIKALDISSKALGFGARGGAQNNQQNNFTIVLPAKSENAEKWAAEQNMKRVGNG